jgi:hypothetical protein
VYVWFEADPADDARVRAAVGRLAAEMADAAGAAGSVGRSGDRVELGAAGPRLLRRPDLRLRDGHAYATWMEVWPPVPVDGLAVWLERLAACADRCGAAALARGGRHVEPFEPIEPSFASQ